MKWGWCNAFCVSLCDMFFYFQGLVFEEERPPPPNRAPLAPMLEFVSAQTGVPVVAVGGGASLGRESQVENKNALLNVASSSIFNFISLGLKQEYLQLIGSNCTKLMSQTLEDLAPLKNVHLFFYFKASEGWIWLMLLTITGYTAIDPIV